MGLLEHTTPPTDTIVSLDEAKQQLNIVDDTSHDAILSLYLRSVSDYLEKRTNRCFRLQAWTQYEKKFCPVVRLNKRGVNSIQVKYWNTDNEQVTLDSGQYWLNNDVFYMENDEDISWNWHGRDTLTILMYCGQPSYIAKHVVLQHLASSNEWRESLSEKPLGENPAYEAMVRLLTDKAGGVM